MKPPPLNERHQLIENLPMRILQLTHALLELRVAQRGLGLTALGNQKLLVAERVIQIEQFFRTHNKTPPAVV